LKWYKDKLPPGKTYGELMHAVSRFSDVSEASLNELLSSKTYPAIIKASALEEYTLFATQRTASQVQAYLQSPDAMLRLSALKALTNFPPETVLSFADRLLDDPVAAVRFEAMLRLAASTQQLSPERKVVFDKVFNEYNGIQQGLTNRPEGYLNQGIVLGMTGKWSEAEAIYLQGLKRFPKFVLLYINLADVYRSQNQEANAKEYIDKGLVLQPENADLHYALGLWYVRKNDHSSGIKELKRAFTIDPKNTSAVYGYAVALFSTGQPSSSIEILESFLKKNGNNAMILDALISICQDQKLLDKSNKYALLRKNVFGY
jgi:tetratricopeptide (TPR) repeat protein